MRRLIKTVMLLLTTPLFFYCGGSNITPPDDPSVVLRAQELAESGWNHYESGNYSSAITLFNDSKKADSEYIDAYNGLGWSYFRAHNLILSLFNFRIPLDSDSTLTDVKVGYLIAAFEKNEYSETIDAAIQLTMQDSVKFDLEGTDEYFFIHDTDVTSREIRKLLALAYYYSGQFQNSYYQLLNFLDPLTRVDPLSETFQKDLLEALENI